MSTNESANFMHFFDLPFEIRAIIYPHIFNKTRVVYDFSGPRPKIRPYQKDSGYIKVSDKQQNAFLQVSKQCYTESARAYFSVSHVIFDRAFHINPTILGRLKQLRSYVHSLEIHAFRPQKFDPWGPFESLKQLVIVGDVEVMAESRRTTYLDESHDITDFEIMLRALSDAKLQKHYKRHHIDPRIRSLDSWLPKEVAIRIRRQHIYRYRTESRSYQEVRYHLNVWQREIEYDVRSHTIIGDPPYQVR